MWNTNVLNGSARNPMLECAAYEQRILAVGGVDLWLLGIGGNGHIAFNEPGSSVDSRTRIVSLTQSTIDANSDGRFFSDPAEVPRCALSAGIGTIREARSIILLATGAKKAPSVAAAINGPFSPDCPASLLQDHPDCTFIIDEAAASRLA
jgi:glucosamine-6-phosphate deaminase